MSVLHAERFQRVLVTLLFIVGWLQLLLWGHREWASLSLNSRVTVAGTILLYPGSWLLMIIGRRSSVAAVCLYSYIPLLTTVMLLSR